MPEFNDIAILGAGLMGHGLAVVHALGGCSVKLYDNSEKALAAAPAKIAAALQTLAEADAITRAEASAAIARISYESNVARALAESDMVVEAIIEDIEAKRRF